jgi:hypothetical protein
MDNLYEMSFLRCQNKKKILWFLIRGLAGTVKSGEKGAQKTGPAASP